MCKGAVKLSKRRAVTRKFCQVVAEDLAKDPTIKMSYEVITPRRKTTMQGNKNLQEMATQ